MAHELFVARAHYHLGNFQLAINEAMNAKSASEDRDLLVMKSHIAQGNYQMVAGQVQSGSSEAVKALGHLAAFFSKGKKEMENELLKLSSWSSDPTVKWALAVAYMNLGQRDDALRTLQHVDTSNANSLESLSLRAQLMLQYNRVDLAGEEVRAMCKIDEDHVLTQLTQAWVYLAEGGVKIDQAYYVFQEMSDKYSSPVSTLVGTALCHMHNGKFVEAEGLLMDALVKSPNHPDALSNLATCHLQMQREKDAERYLQQLQAQCASHPHSQKLVALSGSFEQSANTKSAQFQ